MSSSSMAADAIYRRFRDFLSNKGLRMTRERSELLEAIMEAPQHFEAEDLISAVQKRSGQVSRATIYRTLSLLEESGILRKSLFGHNRHFYESVVGRHHHDHLVCVRCGRIKEFEDERIERFQEEICEHFGFEMVDHVHEIFGLCPECRKKKSEGS